ncbi:hypothetical protein BD414DRAFT_501908, partial [Trametes punicea]
MNRMQQRPARCLFGISPRPSEGPFSGNGTQLFGPYGPIFGDSGLSALVREGRPPLAQD